MSFQALGGEKSQARDLYGTVQTHDDPDLYVWPHAIRLGSPVIHRTRNAMAGRHFPEQNRLLAALPS